MRRLHTFTSSALLLGLLVIGHSSLAQQDTKPARKAEPSPQIQAGLLAGELATYGYNHKDALPLATAAQIMLQHPPRPLTSQKQEAGAANTTSPGTKTERTAATLDPTKLLADARQMATADAATLALIDKLEKTPKSRGRVYGPANVTRRVEAGSVYTDFILFEGNALAEVVIIGDGDCDLDLYVYDENGNLIAKDDDNTDRCYVSFVPSRQSSFRIRVVNRGNVYANYVLMSN
ncbi:hypothetical protein ACAW74_13010 [Fibrella sp. WM1]|uniref:hypothetical protein n=1 Tax=Fibrella musci TaxID=3242485 RepID=UPI0035225EE8